MTYANPIQRHEIIYGLSELADFLESNPGVPAPPFTTILVFPPRTTDIEQRQEIDVIASRIGSGTATTSEYCHYVTSRAFGAVEYRAVSIPADSMKEA